MNHDDVKHRKRILRDALGLPSEKEQMVAPGSDDTVKLDEMSRKARERQVKCDRCKCTFTRGQGTKVMFYTDTLCTLCRLCWHGARPVIAEYVQNPPDLATIGNNNTELFTPGEVDVLQLVKEYLQDEEVYDHKGMLRYLYVLLSRTIERVRRISDENARNIGHLVKAHQRIKVLEAALTKEKNDGYI